jgi:predicted NAD-dependent protein-ADP-ribosyltransferase YbiA (DUF1768 family)
MKIFVFYKNQPVLEQKIEKAKDPNENKKYGLNRDRNPDTDWSELRSSLMDERCEEVELTPELKTILLEDLAYTYGSDTSTFHKKLVEFGLI